jgi:peptide/nickel transport system substrate-binding protein
VNHVKPILLAALLALSLVYCRGEVSHKPTSINIAVPYEIDTLDPHAKTRLSNYATCSNFYEPLVATDASNKILPRLAQSWENPDGYTWVFHLHQDVHFHNGKMMNAQDVVYSLERVIQHPELEVRTYLNDVAEVRAVDALTVLVKTKTPLAIFLNKLNNVLIIPRGAADSTLGTIVNGTGPYRLQEWSRGNFIRMERNEDYWGKKPALKQVTYYLDRDADMALSDLVSGKCQLAQYNSKKLESVIRSTGKFDILREDNYFLKYLSYDVSRDVTPYCDARPNPFKNPLVRKAIQLGIDRRSLVEELPTYAVPADQPVPPFVFGYNPGIKMPEHSIPAAKELLRRAGYPNGFKVTLFVRHILQDTGALIRRQLGEIGIQTDVRFIPDPEFFKMLDANDFTFFLSRVGATTGDASDILEPQLHSRDAKDGYGVRNYIGYSNPAIDSGISASAQLLKLDDRREALEEMMSTLMEDLPWIPLYIDQDVYALDHRFVWSPRHDSHVFAYEIGVR